MLKWWEFSHYSEHATDLLQILAQRYTKKVIIATDLQ